VVEGMRRSTTLMAALLLLVSLAAAYMSIVSYGERREEEKTRQMFVGWKARYNKTYRSIGEEEHHYAAFKVNHRLVGHVDVDADAELYSYHGLNVFADLTTEEFQTRYLGGRRQRGPEGDSLLDFASRYVSIMFTAYIRFTILRQVGKINQNRWRSASVSLIKK
jgi:hypothetical protein